MASMTQRNFELVAAMVADICELTDMPARKVALTIRISSDYLKTTNDRFNPELYEKRVITLLERKAQIDA